MNNRAGESQWEMQLNPCAASADKPLQLLGRDKILAQEEKKSTAR